MKAGHRLILYFYFTTCSLSAGFVFSSKDSKVLLGDNAKLIVSSPIVGWDGTLVKGAGSEHDGEQIDFSGGSIRRSDDPEARIEGTFDRVDDDQTYGKDCIYLENGQELDADGPISEKIIVVGTGNRITGAPRFEDGILLVNNLSGLNIGVSGQVDQNIQMNDGVLELENDLSFATDAGITGTGLIVCNDYAIDIANGSRNGRITFVGVHPLKIHSRIDLENRWSFQGYNVANGNGCVLDISHEDAELYIMPDSTLVLNDFFLRGVTDGKLIFGNDNSQLRISGGGIGILSDINTTVGQIYVEGPTTFSLRDWDWLFTENANLTVDSVTLWVDTMDRFEEVLFGKVKASGAFLSYINGASVRQLTDQSQIDYSGVEFLLSGALTGTVYLHKSIFMHPRNQARFIGDTLLTASGADVVFSGVSSPQMVIFEEKIAVFQDIKLMRVHQNTFEMRPHSSISFDRDVEVELSDNLTFNTGVFRLTGDGTICYFRGVGGPKKLTLEGVEGLGLPLFHLRHNTLAIEDITLNGLEYMKWSREIIDGQILSGALALMGKSVLVLNDDTDMNLIIQGRGNEIHLTENDIHLRGKMTFGDLADNSVSIRFLIRDDVDQFRVYLDDYAVTLASSVGRAGIIFDDFDVTVVNLSARSLLAGEHSYIGGKRVTIERNPIRQTSSDFSLESGLELYSDLSNPIDDSQIRSPFNIEIDNGITTAFSVARKKESSSVGILPLQDNYFSSAGSRSIRIPRPNLRIKKRMKSGDIRGAIRVEPGGILSDFSPHDSSALSLELSGGARVYTRVRRTHWSRRPVRSYDTIDSSLVETFKTEDQIFVAGTDNKIIITGHVEFKGDIILDEGAELIFEFDDSLDTDKSISFGHGLEGQVFKIELPATSSLVFQGSGDVFFEDKSQIDLQGYRIDELELAIGASYEDDRPSLIFRNFAKLLVDYNSLLEIGGNGSVVFQDNAQAKVLYGHLVLGLVISDYIDLTVDRAAAIRVGRAGGGTSSSTVNARVSLPSGLYNVMFNRSAQLSVRQGGVFETSLLEGEYFGGKVNTFTFDDGAILSLSDGGLLAFGMEEIRLNLITEPIVWDNVDSKVEGDGFVGVYVRDTLSPFVEGKIQPRYFSSASGDAYGVLKQLIIISPDELNDAVDFLDRDGNYKLLTSEKQIVSMDSDDRITHQDSSDGYVYGWKADGREFRIWPDGTKQYRGG